MDYLDASNLFTNDSGLSSEQIKYAALCLMLNPNAYFARATLIYYALPNIQFSNNPLVLAACSYTSIRLARGIHTYDRNKYPLLGFIYLCYRRGFKDACSLLNYDENFNKFNNDLKDDFIDSIFDLKTERLYKIMANPYGKDVKLPFKHYVDEKLETKKYLQLKMSKFEFDKATELLNNSKTTTFFKPKTKKTTSEDIFDEYSIWFAEKHPATTQKKIKNQEIGLLAFKLYKVYNINAIEIFKKISDVTYGFVRYQIYNIHIPAYEEFILTKKDIHNN